MDARSSANVKKAGPWVPALQHTADPEELAIQSDLLPDTVLSTKQRFVQVPTDDRHGGVLSIVIRRPPAAKAERHIEHREKIGGYRVACFSDMAETNGLSDSSCHCVA
jgi:hypothetical protein